MRIHLHTFAGRCHGAFCYDEDTFTHMCTHISLFLTMRIKLHTCAYTCHGASFYDDETFIYMCTHMSWVEWVGMLNACMHVNLHTQASAEVQTLSAERDALALALEEARHKAEAQIIIEPKFGFVLASVQADGAVNPLQPLRCASAAPELSWVGGGMLPGTSSTGRSGTAGTHGAAGSRAIWKVSSTVPIRALSVLGTGSSPLRHVNPPHHVNTAAPSQQGSSSSHTQHSTMSTQIGCFTQLWCSLKQKRSDQK
jgi:hypothetical protein